MFLARTACTVATPASATACEYLAQLSDAAQAELKAIEGENFEALVAANGQLVEACEGCHKQFKPSLPSEGVVHAHAH